MEPRNSFIFYRSFHEAAVLLKPKDRSEFLFAICDYALDGVRRKLPPTAEALFLLVEPILQSNQRKYENGRKGGRPRGKPKENQTGTQAEPYADVDGDGDADADENENENENEAVAVAVAGAGAGAAAPGGTAPAGLWAELFAGDDAALVAAAVKSYIASDEKGYPPHIGAIKNAMYSLCRRGELDEAQAWELVRRAASRSAYGAQEEFDAPPEEVRQPVGSPGQLRQWALMDSDAVGSVVASNFQRVWRARRESRRRSALLPPDVGRLLEEARRLPER